MKEFVLSKRMETVVNMVSPQSFIIADVGCDHAYVSIALIKRGIAKNVIAMDVRKGPLDIAKRNISEYEMKDFIETRLSDGFEKLQPGEADTIIIAGMGGLLMKGILEKGIFVLSWKEKRPELILQPQSDIKEIRLFLIEHSYHVIEEKMVKEEGKIYTILKAIPEQDDTTYTEAELIYGEYNLRMQDEILYSFLERERVVLQRIVEELERTICYSEKRKELVPKKTRERLETIRHEMKINEEALNYYKIDGRS